MNESHLEFQRDFKWYWYGEKVHFQNWYEKNDKAKCKQTSHFVRQNINEMRSTRESFQHF